MGILAGIDYSLLIWIFFYLSERDKPHTKIKKRMSRNLAVRLAAHQWDSGYQELLNLFELQSLKQRRLYLKLGLMFKIIHRLCYFPSIPACRSNIFNLRASHSFHLDPPFARTNAYKFSFFPHTMAVWNSLNNDCVTSASYSTFMKQLRNNV